MCCREQGLINWRRTCETFGLSSFLFSCKHPLLIASVQEISRNKILNTQKKEKKKKKVFFTIRYIWNDGLIHIGNSRKCTKSARDFACNICWELAQEYPKCGHLYCWPCLYKWLHFHSKRQECPLCMALVEENKLVRIYGIGGGKAKYLNPRSKPISNIDIPYHPTPKYQLPEDLSLAGLAFWII